MKTRSLRALWSKMETNRRLLQPRQSRAQHRWKPGKRLTFRALCSG